MTPSDSSPNQLAAVTRLSDELRAEYLEFYSVLPLEIRDDVVVVGTWTETPDQRALDDLACVFDRDVVVTQVDSQSAVQAVRRAYGNLTTAHALVEQLSANTPARSAENTIDDLVALANEAPVIQLVNLLILEALEARASDIHLESTAAGLRARYRIDGILQAAPSPPAEYQAPVVSRLKIMADLDIAERRVPQDGRIRLRLQNREVDVRVSTLPSLYGEDVVLRLLDQSRSHLRLHDLGMAPDVLASFRSLIERKQGMVLVTGPTGSGKTTTLYAGVAEIKRIDTKIVTVEDPVEYALEGITQVHVNPRVGLTFAVALRAFLRQDPDVMLVGEIRDSETADIAAHAALTGHLVLSTLHTNDAPSAITRLLDLGVPAYLLASTIEGVVAQRLVRRICATCATSRAVTQSERAVFDGLLDDVAEVPAASGCNSCRSTGYIGRIGIYELLIVSDELRRLMMKEFAAADLRAHAAEGGLRSLLADGTRLIKLGMTTPEEVLRIISA